jgi:hypothetical protein
MSQLLINQYLADLDKLKKLSCAASMVTINMDIVNIVEAMLKAAR